MIEYKNLIFDKEAIKNLYLDNEWYAYTNNIDTLYKGIKNSLDVIGAYDNQNLIGLIRTIGDKETVIYIQDILILKKYQSKGIGSKMISLITDKYKNVRQIVLMTGNTEKQISFYEKNSFKNLTDLNLVGFTYKKD